MPSSFFLTPLLRVGGHHVTAAGLAAFVLFFGAGVLAAHVFQSDSFRRLLTRLKLGKTFAAMVPTVLSLAALVFATVTAINAAGVPLAWTQPMPGISLTLVQIFLLVSLLLAVFWLSGRTRSFLFNRFLVHSGLDRSLQYAISQIVSNVVLVVGVFVILDNAGIHLGTLTVFAGAVGVGVGFGLQNITSNFISGLVILAERPITIGDRVEVAGVAGQVHQIRARSTVIITNDNIAMIVPNTKFIDSPVTNWTYGDRRVRFRIPLGVSYESDLDGVQAALLEVARDNSHVLSDPAPTVFLKKFGESAIELELVVWSNEMSHRPSRFRSDLNFAISRKFKETKIEMPLPQRDLRFRSGGVRVELTGSERERAPAARE
ncbi:MAG: mechanosensitive ion channel domain-containing protein [Verrucomicrobiota bacterium]